MVLKLTEEELLGIVHTHISPRITRVKVKGPAKMQRRILKWERKGLNMIDIIKRVKAHKGYLENGVSIMSLKEAKDLVQATMLSERNKAPF